MRILRDPCINMELRLSLSLEVCWFHNASVCIGVYAASLCIDSSVAKYHISLISMHQMQTRDCFTNAPKLKPPQLCKDWIHYKYIQHTVTYLTMLS